MPRLPQPPISDDMADIKRSLTDIISFLRTIYDNGMKCQSFTQDQIDSFTDLSFVGTRVQNTTTGEQNVSFLDSGVVNWRAI